MRRLLAVLLLLPSHALGAGPVPAEIQPFSLSAKQLLETAATPAARVEFGAVILQDATRFEITEHQLVTLSSHRIYRIDDASPFGGLSQIQEVWDPSRQSRPTIRARVVTPDGREHLFDSATLSDESASIQDPTLFNDVRVLRGPLPAIVAGSVVETHSVVADLEPLFRAGQTYRVLVGFAGTIEQTLITVSVPNSVPLRYATRALPDARITDETRDDRREVNLRHGLIRSEFKSLFVESIGDQPIWPEFRFSTGNSWASVALAYHQIVEPFIRPDEVRSLIPTSLPADRKQRIDTLLTVLHERVRYTGVLFGLGKLVPNPPSVTLERRFGDCKDKAVVFASMLRAAGIPAQVALLKADSGVDVDPDLPGIGEFNHMIVHVPGEQPLWIDATAEHMKTGELPHGESGRWALVIEESAASLLRTPDAKPTDNYHVENHVIHLPELGPSELRIFGRQNGPRAAQLRGTWSGIGDAERKAQLELIKGLYTAEKIERFDIKEEPETGFLTYELVAKGVTGGHTDFRESYVVMSLQKLFWQMPVGLRRNSELFPDPESADGESDDIRAAPRTLDWVFQPFVNEWQIRIVPPKGFRLRSLPASSELQFGPAAFTREYRLDANGDVIGTVRLDSVRGRYSANEAREFLAAFQEHEAALLMEVRFDHEAVLLSNSGDEAGALRRLSETVRAEPDKAIHHMRLATKLKDLGLMEDAKAEALKATKIEPSNSDAFARLASILEKDGLGRSFGRGYDRDGAVRAFKEAIRLAPDNHSLQTFLASLAEHNALGERFGQGADLNLAIASYRIAVSKLPQWEEGKPLLIQCLFRARRFDEAHVLAAELADDPESASIRLAARVMTAGARMALLEDAGRSDKKSRETRIEDAVRMLWSIRSYEQARELVKESAIDLDAGGDSLFSRLMARTVRMEDLPAPAATAAGAADALIRLTLQGKTDRKVLEPLFSEKAELNGSFQWLHDKVSANAKFAMRSAPRRADFDSQVPRDLIATNFGYEEAEIAGGARRVDLLVNGLSTTSMYFAQERNGWRLMAGAPHWHPIGREVLANLAAGDLATARAWLESVREDLDKDSLRETDTARYFARALPRETSVADETAIRLAAYVVMLANTELKTVTIEEVREATTGAATDDQRRLWQLLLYLVAMQHGDGELMVSSAAQAFPADESSSEKWRISTTAYRWAGRWQDAESLSRAWLAAEPNNTRAMNSLTESLNAQGRGQEALDLHARQARLGRANASQLNLYAWQALVVDAVDDAAVKAAEGSYNAQSGRQYNSAHTLACIYAVVGRIADSRRILLKALEDNRHIDPLDDGIWLVRGLIAERLGMRDSAITAFREIEPSSPVNRNSSYDIAKMRLAKLAGK